jgi:dTDP-4-dehydrorhamnose reductase
MSMLIIGSSGYLGKALERKLTEQGYKVFGTNPDLKSNYCSLSLGDLDFTKIPDSVNEVIILAGISGNKVTLNPSLSHKINVKNTELLIDEFIKREIVINYVSSSAVFNSSQNCANESDTPKPASLYGQQKLKVENHLSYNCKNQKQFRIIRATKILSLNSNLISEWLHKAKLGVDICVNPAANFSPIGLQWFVDSFITILMNDHYNVFHLSGANKINLLDLMDNLRKQRIFTQEPSVKIMENNFDDNAIILGMQETNERVGIEPQSLESMYKDIVY